MSETLFRGYEQDYQDASNSAKQDLALLSSQSGEKKKSTIRRIEKLLDNGRDNIRQMDTEANSIVDRPVKDRLKKKVQACKQDLEILTSELNRSSKTEATDRTSLLGKEDIDTLARGNRSKLASTQISMERGSDSLARSLQLMEENESIGIQASQSLREQGEQIVRTHQRIYDTDSDVKRGGKLIGNMTRRQITNRVILALIVLALLIAIGICLFFIIRAIVQKYETPAPAPQPTTTKPPTSEAPKMFF
ncbi:v-SNARE family protein 1 [Acrasis kona]|uniref:V-SNARE family protein 1 n=1 Tax=Acrasis kona TaxID=1008807 RepID=A0AAW2YLB0_9EUKA